MQATFKQRLLQILFSKKNTRGGFTLIELLVVVIIVGILAAVALPNLLAQIGKARETEAKNGIGTVNRAQQATHFEQGTMLSLTPAELEATNRLGIVLEPDFYDFTATASGTGNSSNIFALNPIAIAQGTRNFGGAIGFNPANGRYQAIACISNLPATVSDAMSATYAEATNITACGANFIELN